MALRLICIAAAFLLVSPANADTSFARAGARVGFKAKLHETQRAHQRSMTKLMAGMTMKKAMTQLESSSAASQDLVQMIKSNLQANSEQGLSSNLGVSYEGASSSQVDVVDMTAGARRGPGYSGVDKAKDMLNEMIEETQKKYDLEIQQCCEYDDQQSSLIEEARQDISNFNAEAAEARKEIADAKSHIEICEIKLPELTDILTDHNLKCHQEITNLQVQLKIVMEDLTVMGTILGMTDCKKSASLLSCADECNGGAFVTFANDDLHAATQNLKSDTVRQVLHESLAEAYRNSDSPSFMQISSHQVGFQTSAALCKCETPGAGTAGHNQYKCDDGTEGWCAANEVCFSDKEFEYGKFDEGCMVPMPTTTMGPMTVKRSGPCKLPVPTDKRQGKCSMNDNPNCPKMQEKFLYIQEGIVDKRDELQGQIAKLESDCESLKLQLESQISYFETQLKDKQTELAAGTKKQNNAEEQSRLKSKELGVLNQDYEAMTKTCHTNYATLEGEECGLKKIRGELYKMKGQDNPAFFQDCVVSEWRPGECSASCAGGFMMLERSIVTHPVGGSKCPILQASKPCNEHKCPIDCKLMDWEEWSACTTKCGGGLTERQRKIEIEPEHGGEPCGETSEADSCNLQSCDKDCVLADWSGWSLCSKECDSGTQERERVISEQLVGGGTCPAMDDDLRHQEKSCNDEECVAPKGEKTLICASKRDIILLLDGSGSLGQRGWDAGLVAGKLLVHGLGGGKPGDVKIALMVYSAKTEIIEHFTDDIAKVEAAIDGLTWPRSITRTAVALNTAAAELSLGRADATSVVILITDGKPMSVAKTRMAARALRQQARLICVPVTRYAPIAQMRRWASKPTKDNFLALQDFDDLKEPKFADEIIADSCPVLEH